MIPGIGLWPGGAHQRHSTCRRPAAHAAAEGLFGAVNGWAPVANASGAPAVEVVTPSAACNMVEEVHRVSHGRISETGSQAEPQGGFSTTRSTKPKSATRCRSNNKTARQGCQLRNHPQAVTSLALTYPWNFSPYSISTVNTTMSTPLPCTTHAPPAPRRHPPSSAAVTMAPCTSSIPAAAAMAPKSGLMDSSCALVVPCGSTINK